MQPALGFGRVDHRVEPVEYQIQEDLLQMHAIAGDDRRAGLQVGFQPHALDHRGRHDEVDGFTNDIVQVDRLVGGFALAEERPHPADDLGGALVVLADVLHDFLELVVDGPPRREQHLRRFRISQDGAERLMELVCERRGELAHRGQPVHVRHRGQVVADLHLGLLSAAMLEHELA